jgi:negative regulator of genetic competence, sporulation and motility
MSKSKKKRDLYTEMTRVEELFGKMCNEGGDEATPDK